MRHIFIFIFATLLTLSHPLLSRNPNKPPSTEKVLSTLSAEDESWLHWEASILYPLVLSLLSKVTDQTILQQIKAVHRNTVFSFWTSFCLCAAETPEFVLWRSKKFYLRIFFYSLLQERFRTSSSKVTRFPTLDPSNSPLLHLRHCYIFRDKGRNHNEFKFFLMCDLKIIHEPTNTKVF